MVGLEGEVWPDMVDSANGRVRCAMHARLS
jgi:hypothetical protein